jgi:hypothetical protein
VDSLLLLLWVAAAASSFLYYIQWNQNARANITATNNWKQYNHLVVRMFGKGLHTWKRCRSAQIASVHDLGGTPTETIVILQI